MMPTSVPVRSHHRGRALPLGMWSALVLALAVGEARPALAQQTASAPADLVVRGATVIDGTGSAPITDGVLVIHDGKVATVGRARDVRVPPGARVIDAHGKWVIPGLIDAHVHYGQSGWFDARPDAADVRNRFSYPEVVATLRDHADRFFRAYECSGVTATFDVGGYPWTRAFQALGERDPFTPHVRAARLQRRRKITSSRRDSPT